MELAAILISEIRFYGTFNTPSFTLGSDNESFTCFGFVMSVLHHGTSSYTVLQRRPSEITILQCERLFGGTKVLL